MSDDVLSLVKAAQKERGQLVTKLNGLKKREAAIRTERKAAEERIAQIDEAFAPLKATLAGVAASSPTPRPLRAPGADTTLAKVVVAIGKFGLREYTTSEIVNESGCSPGNVYNAVSQLVNAGRVRRIALGRYRTTQAQIVGDGAA